MDRRPSRRRADSVPRRRTGGAGLGDGRRCRDACPIGQRNLGDHHAGRWQRFSWFGFRQVMKPEKTGPCRLKELPKLSLGSPDDAIADMEALLIKALGLANNLNQMNFKSAEQWTQVRRASTARGRPSGIVWSCRCDRYDLTSRPLRLIELRSQAPHPRARYTQHVPKIAYGVISIINRNQVR
jgi:hypothetical protein